MVLEPIYEQDFLPCSFGFRPGRSAHQALIALRLAFMGRQGLRWVLDVDIYRKDQVVFSQGDPADAVFYIQKGKVKVTVVSEQGKEAVVAILGAGDFFGEACLAGQARRLATVAAMADSIIVWQAQAADLLFVLALWGE